VCSSRVSRIAFLDRLLDREAIEDRSDRLGAARAAGIPRAKIDTLTAWWETELHSEAEQAALRYAEALTRVADTDRDAAFQRFHDPLAEHFGPEEMLEIVAVVVNMNVWTRIKLAEGAMPGPAD
jgi:alkylhydroperoxidase family enzyme